VTLTICNAGKVDVDAYLVHQSSASTSHIAPAECAVLEHVDGPAKPGTIGFGLVSGEVVYAPEPLENPADGNVLICCSQPVRDVVVDL